MKTTVRFQQWLLLIVVLVAVIFLAVVMAYVTQDDHVMPAKEKPTTRIQINDSRLGEEHFVASYGAQMNSLQKEIRDLQTQVAQQKALDEKRRQRNLASQETLALEAQDAMNFMEGSSAFPHSASVSPRIPQQSAPVNRLALKKVANVKPKEEKVEKNPVARNRTPQTSGEELLITGTFAKARLLNGVDAPTGGQANGNPVPLLMELTDAAVLPNRFRSDIKRCFVTANATGDLSSERVLVRLDRLSCLTKKGMAIDVKLTGYVSGEDGKTGIKARVVTRSGQAIANALLVGSLSGLGKAVSLAAQESTTHFSGSVTESVTNPWKAGLGDGMQDALGRVADYYLKLADKIFPVLEIDAGRQVEIVITQSAMIKTEKPLF